MFNGKNKLFFFASFEQIRNRGSGRAACLCSDRGGADWRLQRMVQRGTGSFCPMRREPERAGPVPVCNSTIPAPTKLQPRPAEAYANNIIPNPDPKASAYLSHFPNPNYTSPDRRDFNNWAGTQTKGINNNNYTARADYNLTKRDSVSFIIPTPTHATAKGRLVPELGLRTSPHHRQLPGLTGARLRQYLHERIELQRDQSSECQQPGCANQ